MYLIVSKFKIVNKMCVWVCFKDCRTPQTGFRDLSSADFDARDLVTACELM